MYRWTGALVLLFLSSSISIAQQTQIPGDTSSNFQKTPTRIEVQAMLQSNEARDQAWGAWWASTLRLSFPEIRKNLEAHLSGTKNEADFAVIDNCLDALIVNASETLPLDLIESIYRSGRKTEALILIKRVSPSAPSDNFLLKLLDEEAGQGRSREWYAAADIMLTGHRPGFVHSILKSLEIKGYVVICDLASACRHTGIGSGSIGDGFAFGPSSVYPPWPYYLLQTLNSPFASARQTLLADGPVPTAYQRVQGHDLFDANRGRNPSETLYPPNPSTRDRFRYIAAAALGIVMYIQDDESLPLVWTNKETYQKDSQQFESDLRARYAKVIEQLRDRGLLTPTEFEEVSMPNLKIEIEDRRSQRTPLQ